MKIFHPSLIGALVLAAGAVFPSLLHAADAPREVNLTSLLDEMIDRDALARWPVPGYTLKEASSHDRSKTDPSNLATWHSNNDHEQFIRTETNEGRQEWVIMEDTGPGAITRYWTPLWDNKTKQVIRFYFDGATTPSMTMNYFDLLNGTGFARPPFAFVSWDQKDLRDELKPDYKPILGVAGDLYLPITFAKSCKITLDSVPFYYVINYRMYDPGTAVQTFTTEGLAAAKATVDRVGEKLFAGTEAPAPAPQLTKKATLAPNATLTLDLPKGSGVVRALEVQIDPSDSPQVLRSTVLEATFDDEAAIWCPLGEFFGTGPRLHAVQDWDRRVDADGSMTARWVMPYRRAGRISLRNLGGKPVGVTLSVVTSPWKWDDHSMIFHANWHSQHDIPTRPRSDWNYIEIQGQGVYVGDTLSVFNPVRDWYGEGDERIYVDGEKLPSMIGTGTEDYYGYAWGMADYFNSPFLSTPQRDRPDRNEWRGYTTDSKLRLLDGIPFRKQLKHDMEIWNWADTKVDYAVGVFWYARPGATSNRQPQPDEAEIAVRPRPLDPGEVDIPNAIECEGLTATFSPGTVSEIQGGGLQRGAWSGGRQLFVHGSKVGDFVELEIPAASDRPKKVALYATKSRDYGIVRFTINGQPAGKDFDGYDPTAQATGPIELGTFTPQNGKLILRAEVVGANPASSGHFFGLDCVTLAQP